MQPVDPSCQVTGAAPGRSPVPAAIPDGGLTPILLESRQRWRDLALLGADLVFETDLEGRLAFFDCRAAAPRQVAAWRTADWLGRPARALLAAESADPFALRTAARDVRAWLRRTDGGSACFSFAVAPLVDAAGQYAGLRGAGRDITEDTLAAQALAAVQRRAEAMEALVRRVRRALLAPQMLEAMLECVPTALGLEGATVLEAAPDGALRAAERYGADPTPLLPALPRLDPESGWHYLSGPAAEPIGLLTAPLRLAPYRALLVWRRPGGRAFDPDERHLLGALSDLLFVLLGNNLLQRELECQARTEPLTGLLNRGAFLHDLQRRLQRNARGTGAAAGTLLFIDVDNLKPINDRFGHGAGDAALAAVARLLRDFARASDLAGRLGGDEFGLWLDGADLAVAEVRARALCAAIGQTAPGDGPWRQSLTLSIGCAAAAADGRELPEALLARADAAMYSAKRQGRNGWAVAAPDFGEAAA